LFHGCGGGVRLAADLGGERSGDGETVGGAGGRCPVKENIGADALGGEVGGDSGEMKRGRPRRAGTGAGDKKRREGGEEEIRSFTPNSPIDLMVSWNEGI
jgi:hypothetical protein